MNQFSISNWQTQYILFPLELKLQFFLQIILEQNLDLAHLFIEFFLVVFQIRRKEMLSRFLPECLKRF